MIPLCSSNIKWLRYGVTTLTFKFRTRLGYNLRERVRTASSEPSRSITPLAASDDDAIDLVLSPTSVATDAGVSRVSQLAQNHCFARRLESSKKRRRRKSARCSKSPKKRRRRKSQRVHQQGAADAPTVGARTEEEHNRYCSLLVEQFIDAIGDCDARYQKVLESGDSPESSGALRCIFTHARAELLGYRSGSFLLDDPIVVCRKLKRVLAVLEQ